MELPTAEREQEYAALLRVADRLLIGLDFDGTLAPIVADPTQAHIHPDAAEVLVALAGRVGAVAVITGRPVRQVLELGGIEEVGRAVAGAGRELFVLGQYGNERWTSSQRRVISPEPPHGLVRLLQELPDLLGEADAAQAWIEEKGLAVAVHTRRLPDPVAAYDRVLPLLREAARRHDLGVEPGRSVVEVRADGMDKGAAVRQVAGEIGARAFVFCGDDLGDVAAFQAVQDFRRQGFPSLLVCSAGEERTDLVDLADVVVAGPGGVLELLRTLIRDVDAARF